MSTLCVQDVSFPLSPFHFIPPAAGDTPISPAVMTLALSIVRRPRSGAWPPGSQCELVNQQDVSAASRPVQRGTAAGGGPG